jgi:hypothetical protein
MRFVFHFEVLPRRRRDLPPGAGPPVSNWPATTASARRSTVSIPRRWWAIGADDRGVSSEAAGV